MNVKKYLYFLFPPNNSKTCLICQAENKAVKFIQIWCVFLTTCLWIIWECALKLWNIWKLAVFLLGFLFIIPWTAVHIWMLLKLFPLISTKLFPLLNAYRYESTASAFSLHIVSKDEYGPLTKKPYVNGVTLRGQNLS